MDSLAYAKFLYVLSTHMQAAYVYIRYEGKFTSYLFPLQWQEKQELLCCYYKLFSRDFVLVHFYYIKDDPHFLGRDRSVVHL
jgi:hypothetical protein